MVDLSVYGGLFAVALVAATLFPLQSEALLAGLLIAGKQPVWMLVAVASVGNVAGSTINWAMGRSIEKLRERRWFPIKARARACGTVVPALRALDAGGRRPVDHDRGSFTRALVVVPADRGDRKNGTLCGDRFLAYHVTRLAASWLLPGESLAYLIAARLSRRRRA
jgi:hypothetical protein